MVRTARKGLRPAPSTVGFAVEELERLKGAFPAHAGSIAGALPWTEKQAAKGATR